MNLPADFPSEGAEQQADQDNDGGPTHETIKLSLSLHKRAQTKWNYTSRKEDISAIRSE